ncbi:MAG: hypothetical protein HN838_09600, partial [Rhodospirillaceae bacterium]|nr:hypothetical protein [Rhodospirillaceae bacterium]
MPKNDLMHRTKSQLVDEINKLQRQTAALKSKISEIRSTHPPSAGGMIGGADGKFQKLVEGSIQGIIVVGLPDWRPLFINEAVA